MMKKRALHKDFRIELKKTWTRFFSIMLIVALGVAFFSGLRACKTDMLDSADAYYDRTNLMDLQLLGSYGMTSKDVEQIEALPEIDQAEGAYTKEVLVHLESQDIVVKTFSFNERVNRFELVDGREPVAPNECMVDTLFLLNTGYQIGDTITLSSEKEELSETIHESTLTIVGSCNDSRYLSFFRGNGEIGNGTINSFLVMPKENYKQEVFSEVYATVAGAKALGSFGEEYDSLIESAIDQIKSIQDVRCEARYDELTKEARDQITSGREDYERGIKELELQKADTMATFAIKEQELESAKQQVIAAELELEKKKQQLYDINYSAEDVELILAPVIKQVAKARQEYETGVVLLEDKKKEAETSFSKALVSLEQANESLNEASAKLEAVKLPKWYIGDRNWIESYVSYEMDADRINAIAKVFPAIFFFVAALVCLTTMTRMVDEQRTQIGILKALGYGKYSIAGKFLKYAFLATLLGSVVGALIGQKLFPYVVINAYRIMYQGLPVVITDYQPFYAVIAGLLAIFCTMGATLFACMKDLHSQPAELMRPVAPKIGKRILLERIPILWNHLNFTKKATLRNLFRYKKRFLMTTIGIAGCMSLIIVGFGVKDSIGVMSELQYQDLWLQDAEVTLESNLSEKTKQDVLTQLRGEERITNASLIYKKTLDGTFENQKKSATLVVLPDENEFQQFFLFRDRISKEETKINNSGIVVTEKYATTLGLEVGDELLIDLGSENKVKVSVIGISENYLGHYLFMTDSCYQTLISQQPEYNGILLRNKSTDTKFEEVLFSDILNENDGVMSISSTTSLNNRISDMLKSLNIIVYVLIICAGLLAFIVLYNLSNININERKRELASLKVLGFYDGEVNSYVMKETIILTLLGIVFGVGLGIVLHGFIIITCEVDAVMFGRLIKPISFFLSGGITLIFSLIICFIMYFKLKKIDMIESLKSVE